MKAPVLQTGVFCFKAWGGGEAQPGTMERRGRGTARELRGDCEGGDGELIFAGLGGLETSEFHFEAFLGAKTGEGTVVFVRCENTTVGSWRFYLILKF